MGLCPPQNSPEQRKEDGVGQPGARALPSVRARRLFPLPVFAFPEKKFRCSRPVKQRRDRIRRSVENSNEAISALNWMAGFSEAGDSSKISPMQMQSMLRVDGLVRSQKPSGCIDGPEAALRLLLRGGTPYDLGTASETLASYRSELVSIPQEVSSCPDLWTVLPGDDRQFLEEESELMLKSGRSSLEESLPEPYWDPVLKWNTKEYHKLVSKLHSIGYFTYTLAPACKVGVFFVWKSSKTKLRMITDARRANALFVDPPGVSLMTGEGLGKVEVVFDDTFWADLSSESAWKIFVGLSDVRDCFHRMRVPKWLARYFAWEAVPSKLVGLDGATLDGTTLGPTKNFKLLKIVRQIGAYLLCRGIHLAIRWIPSELNASDKPSRIFDDDDSKLLVDLIALDDFEGFSSQLPKPRKHEQQPEAQADAPPVRFTCGDGAANCIAEKGVGLASRWGNACTEGSAPAVEIPGERYEAGRATMERAPASEHTFAGDRGGGCEAGEIRQSGRGRRDRVREHIIRMGGREKRRQKAYFRKESKKMFADQSESTDEWLRSKPLGVGGCGPEGSRELREEVAGDQGLHGEEGLRHEEPGADRLDVGGFLQPEVSGRRGQSLWRLYHGDAHGSPAKLQQVWTYEATPSLEKLAGVAQAGTSKVKTCISLSSLVRDELADGCERSVADGYLQPAPGLDLPQAWHFAEAEEVGACSTYCWGDWNVVHSHKLERDKRHFQGGNERRQFASGFGMAAVHQSGVGKIGKGKKEGQGLGIRLQSVSGSVSSMCQRPQPEHCPLPSKTFWSEHRQSNECTRPRRSEETRRLDDKDKCQPVRERRKIGSHVAEAGSKHSAVLQDCGALHRGNYPRPRLSKHPIARSGEVITGYVADYFSGSGRVARAVRQLGFSTREWELSHGDQFDLTHPCVLRKVKQDIDKHKVIAAMLAPPCSSFSPARDRTSVIRTKDYPWGLPGLSEKENEAVRLGNRCMRAALRIIRWLDFWKIPWIFEQPHCSKAWFTPELIALQNADHTHVLVTDFCQFHTQWRKRTRLLAGNVDWNDFQRCGRLCTGKHGVCSRSNRLHFQLTGSNPQGVPWTRIAQPYPHKLCRQLAHSLTAHRTFIPYNISSST